MKKRLILFLLSNFRAGGAETQYANLVRNIDRERFKPILGIIEYKDNVATDEFLLRFGDVSIVKFRRHHVLDVTVFFKIRKYISKNKIDVVQTQIFMDNQIGRLASIGGNVPVVTSVRGEYGAFAGPLKTWFEFKAQFLSTKVVVNSYWLKKYVETMGIPCKKIVPIHNGVDFDRYIARINVSTLRDKYNISKNVPVISIVARLHTMKDHVTFFNSIDILKAKFPEIIALVVGEGPEHDNLRKYVHEKGLTNNVKFLGVMSGNLSEIYKVSDVVMLTSQWGESFPNVVLEAMSASVPVVASNISAIPEIIQDGVNGFIAESKDAQQFADKAALLLSDASLKEKITTNANNSVKQFSIPVMVEKYEKLYTSLMDV